MKILFWNIQSGNPLETTHDRKGGQIQSEVLACNADLLIFCEVLDIAMDFSEIYGLQRAIVLEEEAKTRATLANPLPGPMSSFKDGPSKIKLNEGIAQIGHGPIRTRAKHTFRPHPYELRTKKAAMSKISAAVNLLDGPASQITTAALMHQPSIANILAGTTIAPIVIKYPYWLASDAVQKDRNYLVYSKVAFVYDHIDVGVSGAKRQILRLTLQGGQTVYVIHAPSFGKGGGETVLQLVDVITANVNPSVAVGDMNIDLDEVLTEVENEGNGQPYNKKFSTTKIMPIGPPQDYNQKSHKRRWHINKTPINKTYPRTQKSGGTLDYVLANQNLNIQVQIAIAPEVYSDHAAIIATVPGW
jgi:hypothetical protein